jgi:hypothetical protein
MADVGVVNGQREDNVFQIPVIILLIIVNLIIRTVAESGYDYDKEYD